MNRKTTYVLLAILAALAIYMAFFNEPAAEPTVDPVEVAESLVPLLDIDSVSVSSVRLERGATEGVEVVLANDGTWQILGESGGQADTTLVMSLINTTAGLVPIDEIDPALAVASDYGLAPAEYALTLGTPEGDVVLLIGPDTISYSGNYAMVQGTDRIVIISGNDEYALTSWLSDPPLAPTPLPEAAATPSA